MLRVDGLIAGYGGREVLKGINLEVGEREIVAVIGHNGAGKTTLLRCIFGLLSPSGGSIRFLSKSIEGLSPRQLLDTGMAFLPQGGAVFTRLTVQENLLLSVRLARSRAVDVSAAIEDAIASFPLLKRKLNQRAGTLSGGERQMLALARCLVGSPRLLLLDEPSLGLSPSLLNRLLEELARINRELGVAILVVEQKVQKALELADRVYAVKNGRITYSGGTAELLDQNALRAVFF